MAKQTATELLKAKIADLEIKQAEEGIAFREELKSTYESLKPINLLKSSIKEFSSSVDLKKTLIETVLSLATSFLSKQLIKPNSGNPIMKFIATLLQVGVTNVVINNKDAIFQFLSGLIEKFIPNAEKQNVEPGTFCE
jgi:hypothetical protein